MPGRRLTTEELQSAIKEINKDTYDHRWPDSEGLKAIAIAVRDKKPTVELNNVQFKIRYKSKFENAVFVSPARKDTFVPCGYFSVEKLRLL